MDDGKLVFLSLFMIFSLTSKAAEVEVVYISPDQQKQLESQFNEAGFSATKDAKSLQEHEWTCDMYGVVRRDRVQHDLHLYKWAERWHNEGAQLVSEYMPTADALVGSKDRFEDQVKITKNGQLVSRLSLTTGKKTVIAYSVCKSL